MTSSLRVQVGVLLLCLACSEVCTELLQNADFESTNYNGNWYGGGCHLAPSNDAYQGQHSAHVSGRSADWTGPFQNVNIQGGSDYKVTAYIKLLSNVHNAHYQAATMMMGCKDHSEKAKYIQFGKTPHVQHGAWVEVGGANKVPTGYHSCHIYVQTAAPTEFLVDHASVLQVPHDATWKTTANNWINTHRKADINIRLAGTGVDSSTLELEIIQQKHEFIFGSAVDAKLIVDNNHHAYQQAFYDNFEWAVLGNDLKWHVMERHQGTVNYNTALTAINALRSHGIKVRGHCAFWAVDRNVQDWVKALSSSDLNTAIHQRIQGVIGHTKGLLEMWDVNNENLHGDFYERHTGNPNITMDMFRQIHSIDNHPQLFLNDYNVISSTEVTVALKDQAVSFKKAGVPIGGIGVQGHMHSIDLDVIKARLDILAEAGLPILITELGINDANDDSRASKLTDLLTLFFSHPAVQGVVFWGFWDQNIWEKQAPLFTGPNVTPNAAGLAYQDLVKKQWKTYQQTNIHGSQAVHVSAFKGDYQINVKHNGQIVKTETFAVSDGGKDLTIHLGAQAGGTPTVSHIVVG